MDNQKTITIPINSHISYKELVEQHRWYMKQWIEEIKPEITDLLNAELKIKNESEESNNE